MNYLRNFKDSYPMYFKIAVILILMLILYKIGYLLGNFIANINL